MRALGPGSVSSFLKIILDVVYVALCISILLIGLGMVASLLFDLNPALFQPDDPQRPDRRQAERSGDRRRASRRRPLCRWRPCHRRRASPHLSPPSRRVTPFTPECQRLRLIGLMLAALACSKWRAIR